MSDTLYCFRCGDSLTALTPPISRQDVCPTCSNYLHVCRMCMYFDTSVATQCREDDAEEVFDKEKANFCDWYQPSPNAFDSAGKRADDNARSAADALFSDEAPDAEDYAAQKSAAEDLFH